MNQIDTFVPKFISGGPFTDEVKFAVSEYFKTHNIKTSGGWRIVLKTIIISSLFLACYYVLILSNSPPWWLWLPTCFILGHYVIPGIGFCVMHDAIHGAYSKHKWVNYLAGLSLNFLGANNFMWKTKHNIIHHTYTNVEGLDDDIEAGPPLRLHDNKKWRRMHRHQHKWFYWRFFYSLLYLAWVWGTDYKKYFTRRIMFKPIRLSVGEHFIFWISKALYVTVFLVIPIWQVGFWWWLLGYLIVSLTCSKRISTIFQLAHVVSGVTHPVKEDISKTEWFRHQVETTADFAPKNRWISWWVGGLNFQIEHHLFPKISHVHYPLIHRIIKPICEKWSVTFTEYPTYSLAVEAHVAELKRLSIKPIVVQLY